MNRDCRALINRNDKLRDSSTFEEEIASLLRCLAMTEGWIPAFAGMTYEKAGMTERGEWKKLCCNNKLKMYNNNCELNNMKVIGQI